MENIALIKNKEILYFTDKIPTKYVPWEYEEIKKDDWSIEKICIKDPIDWVDYDKAIKIPNPYDYNKDYYFDWENIIESWKPWKEPRDEKQTMIDEIKDLWKQGEELRSKYLSAELLPESEIKTETLRILKEKWDLIMSQYVEKQKILVEKYGVEILQEIL